MTNTLKHVLRRGDGMFFCQPPCANNHEWTANQDQARRWLDHDSCKAAAWTWEKIKGEPLEVVTLGQ